MPASRNSSRHIGYPTSWQRGHSARKGPTGRQYDQDIQFLKYKDTPIATARSVMTQPCSHPSTPLRVVLERTIVDVFEFEPFDHIENNEVHVPLLSHPEPSLGLLEPRQIQAFPADILDVVPLDYKVGPGRRSILMRTSARDKPGRGMFDTTDNYSMSGEDTTEGPYMDPSVSDSYDAPEQYTYNLSAVSLRLRPLAKSTLDPVQPLGSIPRYFFILPTWRENVAIDSTASFLLFRFCVCQSSVSGNEPWTPHLIDGPPVTVDRTAQFIKLFGPALIQNTVLFLNSLLALNVSSSAASGIPVPPLADYHNALGHLQNRLGLDTVDLVEPYIQATIAFLKQQIPGGDSATPSIQLSSVDLSLVSHYTSPKDWNAPVEPSDTDMDIDSEDVPGTFLAVDSLGRRQYVCYHHYRQLYDTFEQNHVKDKTNDVGKYDVHNGKITADLGSPEELDAFCRVEPAKVGFVSEFDVAVHYDASVDERRRLNDFASSLGISTMYIFNSSSRTDDPDTFGKTPIGDKATETSYVLDLLRKTIGTLTRATFIWNSALDSTTLLDDVTRSRDKLLYLTIKSSRQQVSTVISRAHLEVRDVKSVIMDLPDTTDPATVDDSTTIHDPIRSGRAQAVTIAHGETSEEDKPKPKLESCKSKISSVFRSNKGLTSLTLECKAKWLDMKGLMKAVKEVVSQTSDPHRLPLRRVILKDNTDNDMTALFDLSQDSQDPFAVPIHLDVTERSESSTMSTVLKNCSGAIRVLNLIGLTTGCPNLLADLLYRKAESIPLVSLMLTLDEIRIQHESMLSKVLALSKDTFKQLTLVAQPQLQDATAGLLRILGELRDCRILVTRTRTSGVETWIDQVRGNVHRSSTLIIVESTEELQLMVPELTAPSLTLLNHIFSRDKPPIRELGPITTTIIPKKSESSPVDPIPIIERQ